MQRNMQGVVLERAVEADADEMEIDGGKKEATYVISPPTADRHRSIFLPTGWEARLQHFRANPVFLWGHRSWGEERDVLGFWREVWVDKKKGLMGRAVYDLDKCERAREVWPMVEEGLIKAVSQGCYTYASVWDDETERIKELPPFAKKAFKDGDIWVCYTDQELLEVSQVLIGSNRQALLETINRGLCTRSVAVGIALEQSQVRLPGASAYAEAYEAAGAQLDKQVGASSEPVNVSRQDAASAVEATPSETREGGPIIMAVNPDHFFRTINEIRTERGQTAIPGGEAVVLPEGIRTVEAAQMLAPEAAEVRTEEEAPVAPAALTREDVLEIVRTLLREMQPPAEIQAEAPAAAEGRALSEDDIEELTDAIVDAEVELGRALTAEEKADFVAAYSAN